MRIRQLGGLNNLLIASVRPRISDILCDVGGEQYGLLEHDRKLVTKVVELVVTQVDAVQ